MSNKAKKFKGKPAFQKMEEYLAEHFDFRYNAVLGLVEYKEKGEEGDYQRLDDYTAHSIHRDMKWEGIMIGEGEMLNTLHSNYTAVYDPFKTYFEGLPKWDGIDYIQQLADSVSVEENFKPLWGIFFRMWLTGCVACALDEKKVNQTVLVFIGSQGIGKTTWMNRLLPEQLKKYYYSGTIDPNNKDTQVNLAECFLINLDELENLNRGELGSLKQMITQPAIRVRRPYGRIAENMPRRASFMGSVNNPEFLKDDTGNRRFLCVEALNISYTHEINIDKVYAQVYHNYQQGERYYFQGDENAKISMINERFKVQHAEIEIVNKHFDVCHPNEEPDVLKSVAELQEFLLNEDELVNNLDLRKLGMAMRASQYQRTKKNGTWYYKFKNKTV